MHRFETGLCVVAATTLFWLRGPYLEAVNSHERQLRVTYDPPRLSVEGRGVLLTQVLRSYSSFSQAADENGVSRILLGFHFRKGVEEGIKHGRKIGKRAVGLFLKPVN
jgi:hypothetical protein